MRASLTNRGGNGYQLQAWGRGTNLHALWDSILVQRSLDGWGGGLTGSVGSGQAAIDFAFAPSNWAEESCRTVSTDGFYPTSRKVGEDYLQSWQATLPRQLVAAGERLAAVLNRSLGDR